MSMTLLRVCRQIYNEARLLPFHVNTFTLNTFQDMLHLPKIFNSDQKDALCCIQINGKAAYISAVEWFLAHVT